MAGVVCGIPLITQRSLVPNPAPATTEIKNLGDSQASFSLRPVHRSRRAVGAVPSTGGRARSDPGEGVPFDDPHVIRKILARLGLPIEVPRPDSPQPPPDEPASFLADVLASIEP